MRYNLRVIQETFGADKAWVSTYSAQVHQATKQVYDTDKKSLLSEVSVYASPRRSGTRVRWKSEPQRIAVMAKLRKAGNLPYERSFDMQRGWRFELVRKGLESLLNLFNRIAYTRFVVGSFLRSNPGSTQQPFHKDTGWILAEKIRRFWYDRFKARITSKLAKQIEEVRVRFRKQRKDAR